MMLSLAGIPLDRGFFWGKFYLVVAGIGSALWVLVISPRGHQRYRPLLLPPGDLRHVRQAGRTIRLHYQNDQESRSCPG